MQRRGQQRTQYTLSVLWHQDTTSHSTHTRKLSADGPLEWLKTGCVGRQTCRLDVPLLASNSTSTPGVVLGLIQFNNFINNWDDETDMMTLN